MKKLSFMFAIITLSSCMSMVGLEGSVSNATAQNSQRDIRSEARFLTDKMGYELGLSTRQYNDLYEINYDFVSRSSQLMPNVVLGYDWAVDDYYGLLDYRNDDIRWVLTISQYRRFLGLEYFYRPIYVNNNRWSFRVYVVYTNHNHFYYRKPYNYSRYNGANYSRVNNRSHYSSRYNQEVYDGRYSVKSRETYQNDRRSDFGTTSRGDARPGSNIRPGTNNNTNSGSTRPSTTERPSNSGSSTTRPELNLTPSNRRPVVTEGTSSSTRENNTTREQNNGSSTNGSTREVKTNTPNQTTPSNSSTRRSSGTETPVTREATKTNSSTRSNSGSSSTSTRATQTEKSTKESSTTRSASQRSSTEKSSTGSRR